MKIIICKWSRPIIVIVMTVISISWCYSQAKRNVIYFKSGGKAIGVIVKKVEGKRVVLQLQSEERITIAWDEIKEFGEITIDTTAVSFRPQPDAEPPAVLAQNALYIEALGAGMLYSLNYERLISDEFSVRIGYSSWAMPFFGLKKFIGVPLMTHLLVGEENHKLVIGFGLEYVKIEFGNSFLQDAGNAIFHQTTTTSGDISTVVGIGLAAYRYQPRYGGFHFQIGYYPFFSKNGVMGRVGISGGLCF